jgi:large conductance mechanosensitive channel
MLKEFKEFAIKGNMLDMAVGVIIGSAFSGLVTALVNSVIMPLLSIFTGKLDFSQLFIAMDGKAYATLAEAEAAGASVVAYGSFISQVLNFLIMAFVVFLFVKTINRMRERGKKEEVPAAPTVKKCPYCLSEIPVAATRCAHCTSQLTDEEAVTEG